MELIQPWWQQLASFVFSVVTTAVIALVGIGVEWVRRKLKGKWEQEDQLNRAYDALAAGVEYAEEQLQLWLKRASRDGALTVEERQEARDIAFQTAKDIADSTTKAFLDGLDRRQVAAMIAKILANVPKKPAEPGVTVAVTAISDPEKPTTSENV